MQEVIRDLKVGQPRTKGKRELPNIKSSINYDIARVSFSEKEGQEYCLMGLLL